jgi:hypothetical protein
MVGLNLYPYVGQAWTLWDPGVAGLNIVSGTKKITHDILTICLLRRGENPLHPDMGMSLEIFEPLSGYAPNYWAWQAEQEIAKWVTGIQSLRVDTIAEERNSISTVIRFIPKSQPDTNFLTFGYYQYQGAIWSQGIDDFLDSIQINGERFRLSR